MLDLKLQDGIEPGLNDGNIQRSVSRTFNLSCPDALNLRVSCAEAVNPVLTYRS